MYLARVVPIGRTVVVQARNAEPYAQQWHDLSFPLARKYPERVKVLADHRDEYEIGRALQILPMDGWLCATFVTNDDIPGFPIGAPVSAGFTEDHVTRADNGSRFLNLGDLEEISFVTKAAVKGAQVLQRFDWPASPSLAARSSGSGRTRAGDDELIHGGGRLRRYYETPIVVR